MIDKSLLNRNSFDARIDLVILTVMQNIPQHNIVFSLLDHFESDTKMSAGYKRFNVESSLRKTIEKET